MTPDNLDDFMPPAAGRRRATTRHVLFAGVAGACVLGAGLGLWARPAMNERQMAVAAPDEAVKAVKAAAPARRIQIVVDDSPAPIGAPIEVLSAVSAKPAPVAQPVPMPEPEPQGPVRPPQGLTRVQSIIPPAPAPSPPKPAPAKAKAPPKPPLAAPKLVLAKAKPAAPRVHPAPVHLAKAAPPPAKPSQKIILARAARAEAAKAAKAKAEADAHRIELAKASKAAKLEQLRLAKAEAKGRAEARAEVKAEALAEAQEDARKRARLASLAHALSRATAHALAHAAKPAPTVELARLDRKPGRKARHELKVEQASARKPLRPVEPSYRARAVQQAAQPHPGLMKVSTTPHCAGRDPGAALVCADPALGAAERQLTRAYQGARAAGVPDAQLQREQQRWLAARSAAAREAPWAVHDVYLARIAELNGMAHDAHGDGY